MGNICRSPMAEGVFRHLARQAGLEAVFDIESAGLGGWHLGEPPDERAQSVGRKHGIRIDGASQQFLAVDFARFDLVLALDGEIERGLQRLAPSAAAGDKIRYLRDFDPQVNHSRDVPDPYYGTTRHFEQVYELVDRSCRGLLLSLTTTATDAAD